jgi:uncharacterized protein YjdB
VSIDVNPDTRTINQGTFTFLTAQATFENGGKKNYTQRVDWSSSDPTIASVSNADGERGKTTGNGPGTVTIRAFDPVSGIDSNDSNQNASITVLGPLQSIELKPAESTDTVGEFRRFTATGHFAGGTTQNITQKVIYQSLDLAVAVPLNTEGDASRVDAVGVGTTIIRATDPDTAIVSNDAIYHVLPSPSPTATP